MDVEIVGQAKNPLMNLASSRSEREEMTTKLLGEILDREAEQESAFEKPSSYQQQQPRSIAQVDTELSSFIRQEKQDTEEESASQNQNNKPKKDDKSQSTSKTDKNEYLKTVFVTLGILFTIFFLKVITVCCPCFNFSNDPTMKEAVYSMFREIIFVLICLLIALQLYNQGVLDFAKEQSFRIIIVTLFSLLIWTLIGIILIIAAQKEYSVWKGLEKNSTNYELLEKLKKYYEDLYYDHRGDDEIYIDPIRLEQIRYSVMRLEFINPVYLPPLKEAFLRKDFNFAKYLAYSYGKTLTHFFNTRWMTLVFLIICVDLFTLSSFSKDQWTKTYFNFIFPVVFLIAFYLMYLYMYSIETKLYPQIKSRGELIMPEALNFHQQYDGIDPFAYYDVIPQPEYLDFKNADDQRQSFEMQDQDDEERDSLMRRSEVEFNRNRQQETHLFGQPNRHESLFIGGTAGKDVFKVTLQLFYILSILYFSAYVSFNAIEAYELYEKNDSKGVFYTLLSVTILCPIIMIIEWTVMLPLILRSFTVATNIEMMKDQKIMEKVVAEQKMERAKVSFRVFQVFKLIRRELIAEMKKQQDDRKLRDITNNQIIEAFHVSGGKKQKFIAGEGFNNLTKLCGSSLSQQESFIFLKKANSVIFYILIYFSVQQGDIVNYNEFSKAVEMNLNDAKIDPYYLVLFLLSMFFNDKKKVTFEEFQQFFGEFDSYFMWEDIEAFLDEVKYIKREREMIDFRELASMIRDDIESFPK